MRPGIDRQLDVDCLGTESDAVERDACGGRATPTPDDDLRDLGLQRAASSLGLAQGLGGLGLLGLFDGEPEGSDRFGPLAEYSKTDVSG